jgi:acyl-[acyl-carrier-protein]-phospholipid O-acyltransferase/long-chain-fatty-acid--[acyl-carrier-protein] ligase
MLSGEVRIRTLVGLWWLRLLGVMLHATVTLSLLLTVGLNPWVGCFAAIGALATSLVADGNQRIWWILAHIGNLLIAGAWWSAAAGSELPEWAAWLPAASIPCLTMWLALTQHTLEQSRLVHMSRLTASWHLAWALPLLALAVWHLSPTPAGSSDPLIYIPLAAAIAKIVVQVRIGGDFPAPEVSVSGEVSTLSRSFLSSIRAFWGTTKIRQAGIGLLIVGGLVGVIGSTVVLSRDAEAAHGPIECVYLLVGLTFGLWEAGRWSDKKVEPGLVPWGAALLLIACEVRLTLGGVVEPSRLTLLMLMCDAAIGVAAAFVLVPLHAWMWWSEKQQPGFGLHRQATGYCVFGIFAGTAAGRAFVENGVPAWVVLTACLLVTAIGALWAYRLIAPLAIRVMWFGLCSVLYRMRVIGQENIPETGPVLIVPNHVSYVDGVLVLFESTRLPRFLVYGDYTEMWALRGLARIMQAIPIRSTDGPKAILKSLLTARETLMRGEVVCIFAEGQITKSGQLNKFQPGMQKILEGTDAVVVPAYLHGLWGSIFSFHGGKYFWKMPKQWRLPVTVAFGKPMQKPREAAQVQQAVATLGVATMQNTQSDRMIPARRFLRQCKRNMKKEKVADSWGMKLTGARLLAGSLALTQVLKRKLRRDEQHVGLLLPPSVGGCLANMAVALAKRVSVNLNYTLTDDGINFCIREAGLKHVITSRKFLEKKPIDIQGAEVLFLEDLKTEVGLLDKVFAGACTYALPAAVVERLLGLTSIKPSDPCTIIFTSGSTGDPKGVVLTQDNVSTNTQAIDDLVHLRGDDSLLGVLPFFHSFGYTVTFWLPMCFEPKGVYHFNPLDSKTVGALCQQHDVTILLATPTFLKSWMRRCTKEQFHKLDVVVVGAEKMPLDLAREFEEKFGVEPTEGYGTTELSPLASVNIPRSRALADTERGAKTGTVGRVIPGCAARVVDADTGEVLGRDHEGLLQISGPNVMAGYLHHPDKTAEVIRDGWYDTGDMAKIDDEGFITITGRLSRFSKIGGEMVPHIRIEQILSELVSAGAGSEGTEAPALRVAVTSVPDVTKGEKLIVLHTPLTVSKESLLKGLIAAGLPNLWVPSADAFLEVEEIPILGSGKLDLRALKQVALKHFGNDGRSNPAA